MRKTPLTKSELIKNVNDILLDVIANNDRALAAAKRLKQAPLVQDTTVENIAEACKQLISVYLTQDDYITDSSISLSKNRIMNKKNSNFLYNFKNAQDKKFNNIYDVLKLNVHAF